MKTIDFESHKVTVLGHINSELNGNDDYTEHVIQMSEKNFRKLLALIPKCDTREYLNYAIKALKDKLTELQYNNYAYDTTLTQYMQILTDELEWQKFQDDAIELAKLPMIIGHLEIIDVP
jgi:hypothetical protein